MAGPILQALDLDYGDTIDLLEVLEQDFGITITDDEARPIETVGELHAFLVDRVIGNGQPSGKCASQMAFYRIRRTLVAESGSSPSSIRPNTPIEPFGKGNLRSLSARLEQRTGLSMPILSSDRFGDVAFVALALSVLTTIIAFATQSIFPVGLIAMSLLAVAIIGDSLNKGRFRADLLGVGDIATVGDLARFSGALSHGKLRELGARTDADVIWDVLIANIVNTANVAVDAIAPETRFYTQKKTRAA